MMEGERNRIGHALSRGSRAVPRAWASVHPSILERVPRGLLRVFLRRLHGGAFRVVYWDGREDQFGLGAPRFRLRINDPGVVWAMLGAVDLGFGEAFME